MYAVYVIVSPRENRHCNHRTARYTADMAEETGLRRSGAVVLCVPGDAADYTDTFRRRYDPHVAQIMPHITLAFATELDVVAWRAARQRIQDALTGLPPFAINVAETGTFGGSELVLWLKPRDSAGEMAMLRRMILQAFPQIQFDRPDDFIPHISIGFFRTREELADAEQTVRQELRPFSFHIAIVSFLHASEKNIWQSIDILELGHGER